MKAFGVRLDTVAAREHRRAEADAATMAARAVLEGWSEQQFNIIISNAWLDSGQSHYATEYHAQLKSQRLTLIRNGLWT